MTSYFFTFGQIHTHRVNGVTLDCDGVLEIVAEDFSAARTRMFELCGDKFHNQHTAETINMKYFPRGVVLKVRGVVLKGEA